MDGNHLAICGKCTCTHPGMKFSKDVMEITCKECEANPLVQLMKRKLAAQEGQ